MEWEKQEGVGIWIPKKVGEEVIGKVVKIDTEGTYGTQLILETKDGEMRTPSHKVLQNRIAKVKEGQTVKIVYAGQEQPTVKGNNPTEMYDVFIQK